MRALEILNNIFGRMGTGVVRDHDFEIGAGLIEYARNCPFQNILPFALGHHKRIEQNNPFLRCLLKSNTMIYKEI